MFFGMPVCPEMSKLGLAMTPSTMFVYTRLAADVLSQSGENTLENEYLFFGLHFSNYECFK